MCLGSAWLELHIQMCAHAGLIHSSVPAAGQATITKMNKYALPLKRLLQMQGTDHGCTNLCGDLYEQCRARAQAFVHVQLDIGNLRGHPRL